MGPWGGLCLSLLALLPAGLGVGGQAQGQSPEEVTLDAHMPPFATDQPDAYLCTAVDLPARPLKLTGVEALASQAIVHHILLFGCAEPAKRDQVWPCRMEPSCGGGGQQSVLFGWGKDAPGLKLPEGVGFSVGPGTGVRTVVMQVHYLPIRPEGDASGVRITLTPAPVPFSAGMVSFASAFVIPPGSASHPVPNECCYAGQEPLHAFGFRVHTHRLGRSVGVQQRSPGAAEFGPPLAQQDPQLPQGFYQVSPQARILPGDRLRTTCEFDSSNETAPVASGHTSANEMCNLYMMLWSEVPYFMYCINSHPYTAPEGPGGLPASGGRLEPEGALWNPPTSVRSAGGSFPQGPEEEEEGERRTPLGQITGIAAGENGTLWVLHRGGRAWTAASFGGQGQEHITEQEPIPAPVVLQLDRDTGKVLRAWGAGEFFMPHMITPDHDGNVWITDVGLHQAFKFSPEGRRLLEIGRRLSPGHDNNTLCKPTHVAVGRDGSVFVADGYCNDRVMRYDASGRYMRQYRLPPTDAWGRMNVPHALALQECQGRLLVADRESGAVHAFDVASGELRGSWSVAHYGLPYGLLLGPYGLAVALVWDRTGSGASRVVVLDNTPGQVHSVWEVPGVAAPHDLALVPAPAQASGAGERGLAVVVAESRPPGQEPSRLLKLLLRRQQEGGARGGGSGNGTSGSQGSSTEHHAQQQQQEEASLEQAASHMSHAGLQRLDGNGGSSSGVSREGGAAMQPMPTAAAGEQDGSSSAGVSSSQQVQGSLAPKTAGQPPAAQTVARGGGWGGSKGAGIASAAALEALEEPLLREHSVTAAVGKLIYLGVVLGAIVSGVAFVFMRRAGSLRSAWRGYQAQQQAEGP